MLTQEKIQNKIANAEAINFMLAGKAHVTFRNADTANRYTYKITKSKGENPVFFVNVMYGADNEGDYQYIGCIFNQTDFRWTRKSKVRESDTRFKVFDYVWKHLQNNTLPECIEIWHEGYCGRCGRLLTVPESIACGFGPECAGKAGVTLLAKQLPTKPKEKEPTAQQGVLFNAETGEKVNIPVQHNAFKVTAAENGPVRYYPEENQYVGFSSDCGITARHLAQNGVPEKIELQTDAGFLLFFFHQVLLSFNKEEVSCYQYRTENNEILELIND